MNRIIRLIGEKAKAAGYEEIQNNCSKCICMSCDNHGCSFSLCAGTANIPVLELQKEMRRCYVEKCTCYKMEV